MITFTITFHGPFRVGTGTPAEGLDARVDPTNPLPSTSLKGVMRAAAAELFGHASAPVAEVFGRAAGSSPQAGGTGAGVWGWTDARFETEPEIRPVTRIRTDGKTGLTLRGALMFGEHVWAGRASFDVFPLVHLDEKVAESHANLLIAAARSVTSVGSLRRRGEGWVTITDDRTWTPQAMVELVEGVIAG